MTSISNVSIVIVNYNTGPLLKKLILSLQELPACQIVVVDNGSTDDSMGSLQQLPTCRCIFNDQNRGFAAACNQAVASTNTELILILNPDCELSQQALQQLIALMQRQPKAGLCSPLVFDQQGQEQRGSRRHLPTPWRILQAYAGKSSALDLRQQKIPGEPVKLPATSGACMLVRRTAWDAVAGMDEGFFLHFEDLDLMYRMQQYNWAVWLQPKAAVTHLGGHSSQQQPLRVSWFKHKSLIRFLLKHHARSILSWTIMPILALLHYLILVLTSMMQKTDQ